MIPLFHDFSGQTVLVFGGGRVGARKARRFAREATVVVVSPVFADADFGDAELVRASPDPAAVGAWFDRVDPALAVAATDDEDLNAAIEREAKRRGRLVNRADTSETAGPENVVVPATVRDDPVVVAIATGGTSPALSRHLREEFEGKIDDAGTMAELTADLREELSSWPAAQRHEALRAVVRSPAVWKALGAGADNARQVAEDVLSEATGDTT